MTLDDAALFAAIARAPSLSAAARRLDRSPAAVSAGLKRLERSHRLRLVRRSTRAMELTAEGRAFLQTCDELLAVWAAAEHRMRAARDEVAGVLRIAAPLDLAQQHLARWTAAFVAQHPAVEITVLASDASAQLPGAGVDVALRYGTIDDSGLVASRLCTTERVVVAAPSYLARHGHPAHPRELRTHRTLAWLAQGRPRTHWMLSRGAEVGDVDVQPVLCGDGVLVRQWALAGEGVALKSRLDVIPDIAAGRLVQLFEDWRGEEVPLVALLPAGRLRAARVAAVVDFVRAQVRALVPGGAAAGGTAVVADRGAW